MTQSRSDMTLVYDFDRPLQMPADDVRLLLGGKAANLAEMAMTLHLPVPPCFTVTTVACREYLATGWPAALDAELRAAMTRVESVVERRFGDPTDPLLVSVRSGAPVSMPGMMDTILNLGLNDAATAGLGAASGDPAFAADCRARFESMFREIVGVSEVPSDPWLQLRAAVEAVFRSWNGERARAYRQREDIPDDLGTAVTVQAMVFGNRGPDSATGVLFTRNPATGEPTIYGDILFDAQGEDVVAGTHQTSPISLLAERMPAVAAGLQRSAQALERRFADLCDIEFTIENGRLWLLQVRVGKRSPQAALRIAVDMAEDPNFPLSRAEAVERAAPYLGHPPAASAVRAGTGDRLAVGLGASPGIACGQVATSSDAAEALSVAGHPVILCRNETSPNDVRGMARATGILTATGGLVSHAAVVARGWGIPAVVGASAVRVGDGDLEIDGRTIPAGSTITIDGGSGEVFAGAVAAATKTLPQIGTLIGWAKDLRIAIGEPEPSPTHGRPPDAFTSSHPAAAVSPSNVVLALAVKGSASPALLAAAIVTTPETLAPLVAHLCETGMVEQSGDGVRLTAEGKAHALNLRTAEREAWGQESAVAALDAFISLDLRMKATVTAWQLRSDGTESVLNDHSDAAYDARVLADLEALHADAERWIAQPCDSLPRLGSYEERLSLALANARAGDRRYVASPRVDSYHSIWFELHEELIALAGRTRADEAAAGRA